MLTISIAPVPADVPGLALTVAKMRLEHLAAFGNTPPSRHGEGGMGPDDLNLDALGGPVSLALPLSQGIYSRVEFEFQDVTIEGTWRGTPFRARLAGFAGRKVDLPATPQELRSDLPPVTFALSVDVGSWFTGTDGPLLDAATASNGEIVCDDQSNTAISVALTDGVARSFSVR